MDEKISLYNKISSEWVFDIVSKGTNVRELKKFKYLQIIIDGKFGGGYE